MINLSQRTENLKIQEAIIATEKIGKWNVSTNNRNKEIKFFF